MKPVKIDSAVLDELVKSVDISSILYLKLMTNTSWVITEQCNERIIESIKHVLHLEK
jgi:hypothetical protein